VSDRFGDMIEDRLDLAIAVGTISDTSLIVKKGWIAERVAVAAPSYIQREGTPSTPIDLKNHTCIVHDVGPNSDVWTFTTPDGPEDVHVSGAFLANEASVVHLAARTGYGIAFLGMLEVLDDLRSGALVRLLNDFPASGLSISLVYPSRRNLAPRTRLVLDFVQQEIRDVQRMLATQSNTIASSQIGRV
jgi:DNA-binding transcriptional LysR family regulator